MAAAQSDRDPPFLLGSEFLNFSAKDTALVSALSSSAPVTAPLRHSAISHRLNAFFLICYTELMLTLLLMLAVICKTSG